MGLTAICKGTRGFHFHYHGTRARSQAVASLRTRVAASEMGRGFGVKLEAFVRASVVWVLTSGESDCGKRRGHRNGASRRGSRASKDHLVRAGCRWWKARCRSHRQKHESPPENRRPTYIRCEGACRAFCTSLC